jgi:alpha/beta superfamily hydrolase
MKDEDDLKLEYLKMKNLAKQIRSSKSWSQGTTAVVWDSNSFYKALLDSISKAIQVTWTK